MTWSCGAPGPLPGAEDAVTWLLAVSIADGPHLTGACIALQAARSARKAPDGLGPDGSGDPEVIRP